MKTPRLAVRGRGGQAGGRAVEYALGAGVLGFRGCPDGVGGVQTRQKPDEKAGFRPFLGRLEVLEG